MKADAVQEKTVTVTVYWYNSKQGHCDPTDVITGLESNISAMICDLITSYRKRGCEWDGEPIKDIQFRDT